MAKKNVSEIESGVGYFMGLATGLMDVVRGKNIPFEAIYRLVTPSGRATLEHMVETAHADWLAEQPKPKPRDTSVIHRIRVARGPLPPFAALETEYGKGNVSSLYDGRPWTKSKERLEHDVTDEEVEVLFKDFAPEIASGEIKLDADGYLESKDLIAWGISKGWIPADEKEAYGVSRDPKTCDLQLKNWLVALGSSALHDGGLRFVAVLRADDRGRILGGDWFGYGWGASYLVLFVRKSA